MIDFLLAIPGLDAAMVTVGIALASAVSIIALAWMASEFFSMPSLKGFAKSELAELVVTCIILILAIILATPGGAFDMITKGFMLPGVDSAATCPEWIPGNAAYGQAHYFLGCRPQVQMTASILGEDVIVPYPHMVVDGVVLPKLSRAYMSLMQNEAFIGFLSGLSVGIEVPIKLFRVDIGMVPFISMVPVNEAHTLIVDFVGVAWSTIAAQKMLLLFAEETMLTIFLPFGLLLRAFPFTRKTGSTVIAVVFAAYFIFPISVLINQLVWQMIIDPQPSPTAPSCFTVGASCHADSDCCSDNCRNTNVISAGSMAEVTNAFGEIKGQFAQSEIDKLGTIDLVNGGTLVDLRGRTYDIGEKLGKPVVSVSGTCASPLTNFAEYESVYSVCKNQHDDPSYISENILKPQAEEFEDKLKESYFSGGAADLQWTKTESRTLHFWDDTGNKMLSFAGSMAKGIYWPSPQKTVVEAFKTIDTLVTDVMQYTVLSLLFLINEIILTLTLMKDFSLLIGGEPRVFGLTKLV